MCNLCNTKPVYEFTNKRKVCKNCFIHWFTKKVLYIIRKFEMAKKGDVIAYKKGNDFRSVVLEEVLKMYGEKGFVEVVKLDSSLLPTLDFSAHSRSQINGSKPTLLDFSREKVISMITKSLAEKSEGLDFGAINKRAKRVNIKFAVPSTIDSESDKIIHGIINGKAGNLREISPVNKKIIKPLYLFLDKEVLLYAKLKGLLVPPAHLKIKGAKKDKISEFIEGLEKKHPEVKRAVVRGLMEL